MDQLTSICKQWPTLAEKTPEYGQLCAYCLIEAGYRDSGIGLYSKTAFVNDKGGFFGNPTKTHWMAIHN